MHRWRFLFSAALIIIIATLFRCWMIDTRPLHSDEGVNFLFVQTTNREGYYPYSHVNYHGPLFFYLITWAVNLIGESEFGLRFIAILFGILTTAMMCAFS